MTSSARNSRAAFVVAELYHLLTCPLCVSFWLIGIWLLFSEKFSIEAWMAITGAAWIFGRAMGWENYPDNEA